MKLPNIVKVKQHFTGPSVSNIEKKIAAEFSKRTIDMKIRPGMEIAITAGSRGIANIARIIRATVMEVKKRGAMPFIVPAMGSHGGAKAEGQIEVLKSLGVTESYCDAPIRATMDVVKLAETTAGVPVYMDKIAFHSDGVILINRIKAHTDFSSKVESGLMKMASIGLGNHKQALAIHERGVIGLREHMPYVAAEIFKSGKVLMGIGLVENAFEETAEIEVIPVEKIAEREPQLLVLSKKLFPRLPIDRLDILFIDKMGKNYSGSGMDTNVIGRVRIDGEQEPALPSYQQIIVSDLSEESHGNSTGIGLADLTTTRLFNKIDLQKMNENVITSRFLKRASIPMVLPSDRDAIETAIKCGWDVQPEKVRFMRIPNTLHLEELYVSEALVPELERMATIEIIGTPSPMEFNEFGYFQELNESK